MYFQSIAMLIIPKQHCKYLQ